MSQVMRLGEWDGQLCVYDEDTLNSEPIKLKRWWPIGLRAYDFYRNYGEHLKNAPVRYGGANGVYEIMTEMGARPLKIQLIDGGATRPVHFEKVPYQCPKVKKGMQTRYYDGQWWKYLKSKGWTRIYD
jgi:hypothetical protein